MRFIFYSTHTIEPWDWTNPVKQGIGGSETHHIEMARRLAARGHEVWSYAPVPFEGVVEKEGVRWESWEKADFSLSGTWIVARAPEELDKFAGGRADQPIWLICQDSFYTTWTPERIAKCTRIVPLCQAQRDNLLGWHPQMVGKLYISSNGISTDKIEILPPVPRNPKKLIYSSSPDRGLKQLLMIFRRVREYIPDLELHCFYGFDNIDKIIAKTPVQGFIDSKREITELLQQPGVIWRGRIGQHELWREWLSAGIWAYSANFTETSCISCMEAQALGAIPICNPIWAVGENVKYGVFVKGDVDDPMTQARYGYEIMWLLSHPEVQEELRAEMIPWARKKFDWERIVDDFETWAVEDMHRTAAEPELAEVLL